MSTLEWVAFVTGFICVYLTVKEKDVNWPIGIVNCATLAYVFWTYGLFAQVGLQVIYVLECVYGWYRWTRRDPRTGEKILRIGRTRRELWWRLTLIGAAGTYVCYRMFVRTQDPAPFWDSLIAVASLIAEYLLCLKLVEGWVIYFVADLTALIVLAALGQWVTFATYLCFTALCPYGIYEWYRKLNTLNNSSLKSA